MPRKNSQQQLRLNVRFYLVRGDGLGDLQIQARSPSAAKFEVYRRARSAGYFPKGFRDFLARHVTAAELRR